MIIHQQVREDYTNLQKSGWRFVDNSGKVLLKPAENEKVIVAIKGFKELIQ